MGRELQACPDAAALTDFLREDLSPERHKEVAAHLPDCETCSDLLRGLADSTPVGRAGPHFDSDPLFIGRYRVEGRIGQGGMGTVYRAHHPELGKSVAVKVLWPDPEGDAASAARHSREVGAVASLDHPNIVRAIDAGEADGRPFLVMDWIDGWDLGLICRARRPSPAVCAELARRVALGLAHAHERGLIHRDVKPSNVMLGRDGEVRLLDLGLAVEPGRLAAAVLGTPDFIPPEAWLPSAAPGPADDLYALGCTLFTLLVGRPPFEGFGLAQKAEAHASRPVPQVPGVPDALNDLIQELVAKEPGRRPASAREVAARLAPLAAGADLVRFALDPPDAPTRPFVVTPAAIDATTKPFLPPRRTSRRWLVPSVVAGAILAVCAVLAVLADKPEPPAALDYSKLAPNVWHDLQPKPAELFGWGPGGNAWWKLEERPWRLRAGSPGVSLLALGRVQAESYRLEIGFQQAPVAPGFGLFFGGGSDAVAGGYRTHALAVAPSDRAEPEESIYRSLVTAVARPDGSAPLLTHVNIRSWAFERARHPREQKMTLGVEWGRLAEITWDGRVCEGVADGAAANLTGHPYTGEFGLYCRNGTVVVTSVRLMVLR